MTNFSSLAAVVGVFVFAVPAFAQSQAEVAEKLNDQGKELMYAERYAEASDKFREAVARVPEPKYFFNLCTSRYQEGKFSEAMTACNAVDNNNPTPDQSAKAQKMIGRIQDEAKAQGINLQPEGGGGGDPNVVTDPANPADPNQPPLDPSDPYATPPGPGPAPAPVVGRPPTQGLFTSTAPDHKYTWTLGLDLFAGGGTIGSDSAYGSAAGGVRVKGDYLLNEAARLGAQAYLQISHFGAGEMDFVGVDTLDIIDLGIAGYKHLCPRAVPRLCLTPLAGVHLAVMSPAGDNDGNGSQVFDYAALGGRLEVGLQYGFGKRMEHVFGVQLGVNLYSRVFSGPQDSFDPMQTIEAKHLDRGGAAGYLGAGYTYRFNTPLGSSPFVTLE